MSSGMGPAAGHAGEKEKTGTCAQNSSSAMGWAQREVASKLVFGVQLC